MFTLLWYFGVIVLFFVAISGLLSGFVRKRCLWKTWKPGKNVLPIFDEATLDTMHFFTPPPDHLGEILFAHSTMPTGHSPKGFAKRLGYGVSFGLIGSTIAFWLTSYAIEPYSILVLSYLIMVGIGTFALGWSHERLQRCIYIGEHGTLWRDGSPMAKRVFPRPLSPFVYSDAFDFQLDGQEYKWLDWHDQVVHKVSQLTSPYPPHSLNPMELGEAIACAWRFASLTRSVTWFARIYKSVSTSPIRHESPMDLIGRRLASEPVNHLRLRQATVEWEDGAVMFSVNYESFRFQQCDSGWKLVDTDLPDLLVDRINRIASELLPRDIKQKG